MLLSPVDASVLTLQTTHRSIRGWEGSTSQLVTRQHYQASTLDWQVDNRVLRLVELAGFSSIHRLLGGGLELDRALISALVERWRQETHSFHLTVGEATITLQDAAVILGLRVDGHAVIGHGEGHWAALVYELLGIVPENPRDPAETKIIVGSSLKLTWLRDHFSVLDPDADDITVERHARAYIMYMFGCILFPDKSGDSVQLIYLPLLRDLALVDEYSWGSATLAYLYRNLCRASRKGAKDIGGCLLLLQIWSWEHIHIGRPVIRSIRPPGKHDDDGDAEDFEPVLGSQHRRGRDPLAVSWLRVYLSRSHSPHTLVYYRDSLDRQREDQMTWQPYTEAKMDALPEICRSGQGIWRARCPLICFDIVEFYLPDRVMRQFGLEPVIPDGCDTQAALHAIDRRTANKNYLVRHRAHVDAWNDRAARLVQGENYTGQSLGAYMSWYRRISILRITNPTFAQPVSHYHPTTTLLAERIRSVLIQCNDTIHGATTLPVDVGYRLCTQTLGSINTSLTEVLSQAGYDYLIPTPPTTTDDDTFHTPSTRGSSSRSSRGSGRSSTRARSSRSLTTTSGAMSPFVPPSSLSTPPNPSPPHTIITYQRASQTRAPTLDVITEADECTPSSSTDARSKRGRGL